MLKTRNFTGKSLEELSWAAIFISRNQNEFVGGDNLIICWLKTAMDVWLTTLIFFSLMTTIKVVSLVFTTVCICSLMTLSGHQCCCIFLNPMDSLVISSGADLNVLHDTCSGYFNNNWKASDTGCIMTFDMLCILVTFLGHHNPWAGNHYQRTITYRFRDFPMMSPLGEERLRLNQAWALLQAGFPRGRTAGTVPSDKF